METLPGTAIPAAIFYQWARQGLPTDPTALWSPWSDALRTALLDAVDHHIPNRSRSLLTARDLAALDPEDWDRALEHAGASPPAGITRSEYARGLAMAAAGAFPEAAFRHRATHVASGLRDAHQLARFANLHPGLGLAEIFSRDDDPGHRAAVAVERIGWLSVVFDRNPEVSFLTLDYLPGGADLNTVDFATLSAEARVGVLEDLKAYQHIHAVAGNTIPAMEIMAAGFHSASAIARAPDADFSEKTGLPAAEARKYQDAARQRAAGPAALGDSAD